MPIGERIGFSLLGLMLEVVFIFSFCRVGLEIFGRGGRFERWHEKYAIKFGLYVLLPLLALMVFGAVGNFVINILTLFGLN